MEWAAFERVSGPLLIQERIDISAAQVAYVMAASQGVKIKGRPAKLADFLFDWDRKPPSEADAAAALESVLKEAASPASSPSS